jgi:hypothetical protein
VEGTITNKWYWQQLQNEVVPAIQGARCMDTFFQQDGTHPHTANVLDILHDVFGSHVLLNQFPDRFK